MTAADPSHAPSAIQRRYLGGSAVHCTAAVLVLAAALLLGLAAESSARDLIRNGAFLVGSESTPDGWSTDQWSSTTGTTFEWKHTAPGIGVIVVRNPQPNDARWIQQVRVEPETWYRLSGFVRGINVSEQGLGATISLMRGFDHSKVMRGQDTGWESVSMWFKTQPGETTVTVACRLGSYGQIASGEAWCTGITLEPQSRPPLDTNFVYGPLDEATTPLGLPTALGLLLLLGFGIALHGRLPKETPLRERWALAGTLILILAIKIALAPYFQYKVDVGSFSAWAIRLAEEGVGRFYAPGYFADYPPGYMYVLWGVGLLRSLFDLPWTSRAFLILLKLPALLADTGIAWLLFARLRSQGSRLAWTAALAFSLNPALVIDSALWGQTDSVLGLLTLLALLAQGARRFELAWVFAALAVLTKPQALLIVPLLVFWPKGWWKSGRPISCLLAVLATVFVVANPFRGDRPWTWLLELYMGTTGYYAETSVNAMNLAALLFGMRHNDAEVTLGLTANTWGFVIGGAIGAAFFAAYLMRRTRTMHVQLIAASTIVTFSVLTRMHERYLYPFFVFAGLLGVTGAVGAIYWSLSALFLVNELTVYLYQETATAGPDWLWRSVAALNTACMIAWLGLTWQMARGRYHPPGEAALAEDDVAWERSLLLEKEPVPAVAPVVVADGPPPWTVTEILVLAGLTIAALALRLYSVSQPIELVFDEVYFVEQGRNYLIGKDFMDPHPPFAKLMIGLGIGLVGDTPFGWRIANVIAGTVLVVLMYLLARELFMRRVAAGLTAFFVATDGLCLVDSRIAVIDIHYVTWAVAAYILTIRLIRQRQFQNTLRLLAIGVVIGISVGAKLYIPFFSFLLVLGSLAVTARNHAMRIHAPVLRYLIKPIFLVGVTAFGVYLLTYLPHFLWGWWHSWRDLVSYIFIQVPGYQAAVAEATHPYSSKWWTWPFLLRPVWYFWKDPGPTPGTVVGIWGSGNPSVWWASVPALIFVTWHAIRERRMALGFVAAGWALHLAPWIGIGRTLFLYHYLPSLLFAFLALAWLLDRLWNAEGQPVERGLMGAAILGSLLPVAIAATPAWGPPLFVGLLLLYEGVVFSRRMDPVRTSRIAVSVYCLAVLAISIYFLPIWLGIPLSRQSWEARMWISGSGIMNWI